MTDLPEIESAQEELPKYRPFKDGYEVMPDMRFRYKKWKPENKDWFTAQVSNGDIIADWNGHAYTYEELFNICERILPDGTIVPAGVEVE